MSTPLPSARADAARESARQANGRFGAYGLPEDTTVDLTGAAFTCDLCGSGFAAASALQAHEQRDCPETEFGIHDDDDDDDQDGEAESLYRAAESFASSINNAGPAEQIRFVRRCGIGDLAIEEALGGSQGAHGELDDLVLDVASSSASRAANNGGAAEEVTDNLEGKRWMLSGSDTFRDGAHPMSLSDGECTDLRFRDTDGTEVTYRVSYHEWVPTGDNGDLAPGYLRGEFRAETEWHAHEAPPARESSPFRPARGERSQMVGYAWERFEESLSHAATRAARAQRVDTFASILNA